MYWTTLFNLINPLNEIQSCELIEELSQYININHSDKNEYINNFEIFNHKFIRNDQLKITKEILNEEKDSKELGIYEFLIIPKTSIITPLLILQKYYQEPNIYKNFIIILPNDNLVQQSIKVLKQLEFYDFSISNEFEYNELKYYDSKNIFILSSHKFKKYIFELKTNKTMEDLFETSYFIFDEFDSLYDPLKSELNVLNGNGRSLDYYYNDSSIIYTILKALDPNLSYKKINIQDGGMASSIYLSMVNKQPLKVMKY